MRCGSWVAPLARPTDHDTVDPTIVGKSEPPVGLTRPGWREIVLQRPRRYGRSAALIALRSMLRPLQSNRPKRLAVLCCRRGSVPVAR